MNDMLKMPSIIIWCLSGVSKGICLCSCLPWFSSAGSGGNTRGKRMADCLFKGGRGKRYTVFEVIEMQSKGYSYFKSLNTSVKCSFMYC